MTEQPPLPRRFLLLALLVTVASTGTVYAVNRWASSPGLSALLASVAAAVVLLRLGHLASRRGSAKAYVALAPLLPCGLLLALTSASDHREADELTDWAERRQEALEPPPARTTPLVGIVDPLAPSIRARVPEAYAPGEVGTYHGLDGTVTAATCEAETVARHVSAQPPQGERLCLVTSTWRNTRADPQPFRAHHLFTEVALDDGTERAITQAERAWSFAATAANTGRPADQILPGDEATLRTVLAVPEGSLPLGLATSGFHPGWGRTFALPLDVE